MKSKKIKDYVKGISENILLPRKENIPRFGKCTEAPLCVPKMERRRKREVGRDAGRNRGRSGGRRELKESIEWRKGKRGGRKQRKEEMKERREMVKRRRKCGDF